MLILVSSAGCQWSQLKIRAACRHLHFSHKLGANAVLQNHQWCVSSLGVGLGVTSVNLFGVFFKCWNVPVTVLAGNGTEIMGYWGRGTGCYYISVVVLKSLKVWVASTGPEILCCLGRDWQEMVLKSFDVWVETGRWWSWNTLMSG